MRKFGSRAMGVIALLVMVYALGPLWAGVQLRHAIRSRDSAALQTLVDWPTLRANLKPKLSTAIQDNADASGVIGGAIKRALGSVLTNAAVETFVNPSNLSRILAGRAFMLDRLPQGAKSTPNAPANPSEDDPEDVDDPMPPRRLRWAFFESPTRFRVEAVHPRLPNSRIVSTLALQGLSWKLVDVDISKR